MLAVAAVAHGSRRSAIAPGDGRPLRGVHASHRCERCATGCGYAGIVPSAGSQHDGKDGQLPYRGGFCPAPLSLMALQRYTSPPPDAPFRATTARHCGHYGGETGHEAHRNQDGTTTTPEASAGQPSSRPPGWSSPRRASHSLAMADAWAPNARASADRPAISARSCRRRFGDARGLAS